MARRRHRKHSSSGFGHMLSKSLPYLAFAYAFVPQVTIKDSASYPTNLTFVQAAQARINNIVGRVSGFNPFPQYGRYPQTINPSGVINKYTGMGLGLLIYSAIAPRGFGGKSLARKLGKGVFWGGILGGFFDPATGVRGGAVGSQVGRMGNLSAIGASSMAAPAAPSVMAVSRVSGFGGTFSG